VDYLQLRSILRSKEWQSNFLALSIQARIQQALLLRNTSKTQAVHKSETILDVNQQAVVDIMKHYDVLQLIHGHTHRMAIHYFDIDGKEAKRIVLGDWYNAAHFLTVSPNNYTID
jgi:UDP-2,3-diacylglucosamine hydrolase